MSIIELIDFSKCELSSRNLQYCGRAREKRGVIYNGVSVISDNRKDYYLKTLKIRLDYIAKEFL